MREKARKKTTYSLSKNIYGIPYVQVVPNVSFLAVAHSTTYQHNIQQQHVEQPTWIPQAIPADLGVLLRFFSHFANVM